ncbi:MAG: hypothetical protein ABIJ08_04085 [Nanoarchaeota archaeon]
MKNKIIASIGGFLTFLGIGTALTCPCSYALVLSVAGCSALAGFLSKNYWFFIIAGTLLILVGLRKKIINNIRS